ncbi:hypothetical protein R6Q59_023886 [Mikania micrantha]
MCCSIPNFLIVWEIVEPHHPSRVMRQFGMLQHIPNSIPLTLDQHHTIHNLNRGDGWIGTNLPNNKTVHW